MPLLPQEVQQQGIRVNKPTRNFLVVLGFISDDDSMSSEDIGDYVATNVQDPLNRTPGVGDVNLFGAQCAMRIWLDPDKLNNFGLTSRRRHRGDQGAERAGVGRSDRRPAGGAGPSRSRPRSSARPGCRRPRSSAHILVRVNPDGSQLKLGDVARVALDAENYLRDIKYNGKPAAGIGDPARDAARTRSTPSNAIQRRSIAARRSFRPA